MMVMIAVADEVTFVNVCSVCMFISVFQKDIWLF